MLWPADYFFVHGVDTITKGCKYSMNTFLGEIGCFEWPKQLQSEIIRLEKETIRCYRHESSAKSTGVVKSSPVKELKRRQNDNME